MSPDPKAIASPSNPRIKHAASLRQRSARDAHGQMLVEGAREMEVALAAGVRFVALYLCRERADPEAASKLAQKASASGIDAIDVSERVFAKLSYRENPDGLLGVAQQPPSGLDRLRVTDPALLVVAVGLEKPGNLGALLRTADAAGSDALILCDPCTDPWNPNVIRASLGTVFTVPVAQAASRDAIDWLRARRTRIVCTSPDARHDHTEVDLRGPTAIVLGEEHAGLDAAWRDAADESVRIPMHGTIDSLNVSVAGAILLYEALRQRA